MNISLIKSSKDTESFSIAKGLGFKVIELENCEEVDKQINKLIENKYNNIILTSEVAGFSENIIKKYKNDEKVNIFITKNKR